MTNQLRGQQFLQILPEIKQDLPYPPSLLQELFSLTSDNSMATAEKIAQTVTQDQGLSAKILALANSAFYGLQSRVTSVSRAIALLGLKEVRNIVLILGAQAVTGTHALPERFDIRAYWEHQLSTGVCCKIIVDHIQSTHPLDADILFTAGLLHDFGMLLTALHRPNDWNAICDAVLAKKIPYTQAEEEHWGLEHGLIGAMTLNSWNLPPELTEPLNWHHSPALAPEYADEAKVICVADALHHKLMDNTYALSQSAQNSIQDFDLDMDAILAQLSIQIKGDSLAQLLSHLA